MPILLTALSTQTFSDITVQPVSINTTLNSTVTFTCEAIADELTFRINGEQANHDNAKQKGFIVSGLSGDRINGRTGELEAKAYDFNNNTNITCRALTDEPHEIVTSTASLLIQG